MCCPFVGSSSPTAGRESWLMEIQRVDPNRFWRATGRVLGPLRFIHTTEMFELVENKLYAYADYSTLLAVVHKPADRPAVAASLNRDLDRIQEWYNYWCMILNPNKTKALVFSRCRTVNPPHGDLVLSVVSIWGSSNLHIFGVKFDSRLAFEDHVHGIVSCVFQRIGILRLVKRVFYGHLCVALLLLRNSSPNP